MKSFFQRLTAANQMLPWIILVGLALGIANYSLSVWPNLGQSMVQSLAISLVIGYGLLVVGYNVNHWFPAHLHIWVKYLGMAGLFVLVGIIGSETEALVRRFAFGQGSYQLFGAGGIYLFNGILSLIIGFTQYSMIRPKKTDATVPVLPNEIPVQKLNGTIPIRQGEAITMHQLEEVIYFEAYDNYSFLYDLNSNKHLCNYSLLFLEGKLTDNFMRIHRKYLINKNHIHKIKPHLKGRFVLEFKDQKKSSITSSTSYSEVIKSLIKL